METITLATCTSISGTARTRLVPCRACRLRAAGFFATVLGELGVEPTGAVMVGDDVESDVGGALDAGLSGVLVRTGKYREDAVRASDIHPTAVVDSIADIPALLRPDSADTAR